MTSVITTQVSLNEDVKVCSRCGEVIEGNRFIELDGQFWCDEVCASNDGVELCEHCGKPYSVNSSECVGLYCSRECALDDGNVACDHCGDIYHLLDLYTVHNHDDEEEWCFRCVDNDARHCESCGELHNTDEMVYRNADWYCSNCRCGAIEEYGYTPTLGFFGGQYDQRDTPFLGIELEIDDGDDEKYCANALSHIQDFNEHFWMTEDGSLNCGIEITGHPMTLSYHRGKIGTYKEIVKTARNYGFLSHDAGTCGLHVHVNRTFFGKDYKMQHVAYLKLLRLWQRFQPMLEIFCRRKSGEYNNYSTYYDHSPDKVEVSTKTGRDAYKETTVFTKAHRACSDSRHGTVISSESCETFEFRGFRGTLNLDTYFASLGFVNGMCHTVKHHGTTWAESVMWPEFINEVVGRCDNSECRILLEKYLESKGLAAN